MSLHFREVVEKVKESGKKTKIENLQNGQEKYGRSIIAYVHIWGKLQKYNLFKSYFKIALKGYLDKFCTRISVHLPKEALNALRKIQSTIGTNF